MPEQFNVGFVLRDVYKKPWCLGKPIGQGGFGLIYVANRGEEAGKDLMAGDYVVKIEPKENGPLFCETHFYSSCAKKDDLEKYATLKKLSHLAMPKYISSGTSTYKDKEYRFLVMDRYSTDLQRILLRPDVKHQLSPIGTLCLMRQVMWSLEYIHSRGYAHGDIKGANLMLKTDQEAYLVDYGLAFRFKRDNVHQPYKIKPECRHNGTIEYTSRDAHDGAQITRRSDLEILGYCVIHWICGKLPWMELIKNPVHVQESKKKSMANVKGFLRETLESVGTPAEVVKFMEFYLNEVNKLEFESEPDYAKIHSKITETLVALGHARSERDNFYVFSKEVKVSKKAADNVNKLETSTAKKRVVSSPKATPKKAAAKKINRKVESESDANESESEQEEVKAAQPPRTIEKSSKRGRVLPQMFDDSIEELPKRSPVVKQKPKPAKKVSNLVIDSPVSSSPARGTPRRAAALKLSALAQDENENASEDVDEIENKKEYEVTNELLKGATKDMVNSPRRPVLVKKVKNKDSRTISTQTDKSYLLDMRNKMNF